MILSGWRMAAATGTQRQRIQSSNPMPFGHPRRAAVRRLGPALTVWIIVGMMGAEALGATFPLRWRWSNPRPHGANIVDMAIVPPPGSGLALQVAERGQIFYTTDFNLWFPIDTGVTNDLRAVTFFFGSRIIVTGEAGRVLYADTVDNFKQGTLIDGATADRL
jgi:hypothetical protein